MYSSIASVTEITLGNLTHGSCIACEAGPGKQASKGVGDRKKGTKVTHGSGNGGNAK